jgi:hypothetical protein
MCFLLGGGKKSEIKMVQGHLVLMGRIYKRIDHVNYVFKLIKDSVKLIDIT